MLTCIACTKRLGAGPYDDDDWSMKSLTSQIKKIAVKACSAGSERFEYKYQRAASGGDISPTPIDEEEEEEREWVAQVEPGVLITFVSLSSGGNDLKRIRFSREMFNQWHAQRWWTENYDKVMELYNVQRFSPHAVPLPAPPLSHRQNSMLLRSPEDSSAAPPPIANKMAQRSPSSGDRNSQRTSSEEEEKSIDAGDQEREWVEEDQPGVFITVRALPSGARELRRVRFSRERFSEMHARHWWEENRARIHQQYL